MTGCLTFEETLEINKNGSMTVSIRTLIPERNLGLICKSKIYPALFSKKAIEDYFDSFNADISVQKYRSIRKNDCQEIEITLFCQDAEKGINSGAFGRIIVKNSQAHLGDKELWVEMPKIRKKEWSEEQLLSFCQQTKDFSATLTLLVPTEIIDTNGTKDTYNQIHWRLDTPWLLNQNQSSSALNDLHARW